MGQIISYYCINHLMLLSFHVQRRCHDAERDLISKKLALQDFRKSSVAEASATPASTFDELKQEISVCAIIFKLEFKIILPHHVWIFSKKNFPVLSGSRISKRRFSKRRCCWKSSKSE